VPTRDKGSPLPPIHTISAAPFLRNSNKSEAITAALSLYEIKEALGEKVKRANWKVNVPQEFHEFFPMFDEEVSKGLPSRHHNDQTIPLKDGKESQFGALNGMSQEELKTLK
jgi:hypothetical protein